MSDDAAMLDFARNVARTIAEKLKQHADELMDMYLKLKDLQPDPSRPRDQAFKKVFDDSERDGEHRKLLFAFHDSAYELHNQVQASAMVEPKEVAKLIQLSRVSEAAYEKLRESGRQHLKRALQAADSASNS